MFRRAVEENILLPGNSIQVGMRGPVYSKDAYDESRSLGFKVVTMSAVREMGLQRLIEIIRPVSSFSHVSRVWSLLESYAIKNHLSEIEY